MNIGIRKIFIICYHKISDEKNSYLRPTRVADFENQMQYLSKTYNPVSLDEIVQHVKNGTPLPSKSIAITFDDGYKDIYERAYPILRKYRIPATVFLITSCIGTGEIPLWDRTFYASTKAKKTTQTRAILKTRYRYNRPSYKKTMHMPTSIRCQLDKKDRENIVLERDAGINNHAEKSLMLSWEEVREMADNNVSFGSHTLTHPFLTKISLQQVRREIYLSKEIIEQQIHRPVTTFAYPAGDFNPSIAAIVKEAGYSTAVSTIPGYNTVQSNVYELRRNLIQLQDFFHRFFPFSFNAEVTGVVGCFRCIYHRMKRR